MANPLKMLKLKAEGFQIIQEIPIEAPPKKVWKALANVGKWFVWDPDPKKAPKQSLDLRLGGHWTCIDKEGAHWLFATVTHIEPNKLLRMTGPMGSSHLPINNVFIYELQPKIGGKSTLLRVGHRAFGFLTPEKKNQYSGGWKSLLKQLKALAES